MARRTEKQLAFVSTERPAFHVHGDGVGGLVLICESNIVTDAVTGFILGFHLGQGLFEQSPVLRRNGHDQISRTVAVSHVFLGLYEMLGESGASLILISMEFQHSFRLRTIIQTIGRQQLCSDFPAIFRTVLGLTE